MFEIVVNTGLRADHPFGPAVEYVIDGLASASLYAGSPMYGTRLFVPRWEDGGLDAAHAITSRVLEDSAGSTLHLQSNVAVHAHVPDRIALADRFGFQLVSEREGFRWADSGEALPPPERIVTRSLAEIGAAEFAPILAASAVESLDGMQAPHVATVGARAWADEFIEDYCDVDDRPTWLAAYDKAGTPTGFVAVGHFENDEGTIFHIGVVVGERGKGYVDDLVQLAKIANRSRGWTGMLSEVDVRNTPMMAAMTRSGHLPQPDSWHKWYHARLA